MSLTICQNFALSVEHANLVKQAIAYEQASLSPNTLRTYGSFWKKFENWCSINNQACLPTSSETISLYLSSIGAAFSFSTLDSTIAAIEYVHEKANQSITGNHDLFRRVRKGIRRTHKENQTLKQAVPLKVLDLKAICCKLGDSLKDCRDKALLAVAYFGGLRRSEIVSLDLEHVEFNDKGAVATLLQSKTSDTAELVYLSYARDRDICPVSLLKAWLEKAQIKQGSIFRSLMKGNKIAGRLSGHSVSEIVKIHFGEEYSGHSTRRGLLTDAAEKNTPLHIMKKLSRHKSSEMVLRYAEAAKGFTDSAVSILGM